MAAEVDGADLMREMIRVLEEHFAPMRATLLDGTISCRQCRALVLEENSDGHYAWHHEQEAANGRLWTHIGNMPGGV